MGTFDGPGLRLVVFLQGCRFRCLYCANPDTIDMKGESKSTSPDHIFEMAVSQKPFFGKRGGITFSGGEPTLQAEALVPLFERLKAAGIHICVDSNGSQMNEHVERLFSLTDIVLLDIKAIDPERHRALTAVDNAPTLRMAEWLEEHGRSMWLRHVLVPGWNNTDDELHRFGRHFAHYKMIERLEVLPYHRLGVHKYEAMKWEYKLADVPENTPEQLTHAREILSQYISSVVVN